MCVCAAGWLQRDVWGDHLLCVCVCVWLWAARLQLTRVLHACVCVGEYLFDAEALHGLRMVWAFVCRFYEDMLQVGPWGWAVPCRAVLGCGRPFNALLCVCVCVCVYVCAPIGLFRACACSPGPAAACKAPWPATMVSSSGLLTKAAATRAAPPP
jgi:hypothetical protein